MQFTLRAVVGLAVAALWAIAPSDGAESSNRALSDFLEGRIAPEVSEFGETRVTRKDIAKWMERARTARLPRDRGIAIANLQNCAWLLLSDPEAKFAAIELLDQWVMPNVTLLRGLPRTSACSYENVVFGAYACYRQAGDTRREKRVLELLTTQAREAGLRDLATLRLASMRATEGKLQEAVEIARRTDSRGEFSGMRDRFMKTLQEELKGKKPR